MKEELSYTARELQELMETNWPEACTPEHSLITCLVRLLQVHDRRSRQTLAPFGLSAAEFDVLATLRKTAPPYELTPTELQKAVLLTSGGLTKVMHQLESRGLIARRVQSGDRRSKTASLTEPGRRLIEEAMGILLQTSRQSLGAVLGERRQRRLTEDLGEVLSALEGRSGIT